MTKEKRQRIYGIYRIILSISILIAGICLAVGCITIYRSGKDPLFSREAVADTFSHIAIPVYLCLALILFGFVWELFFPSEKKKPRRAKIAMTEQKPRNEKRLSALRLALLCAAVGIFVYGFATGGTAGVLTKAINICTECIGLG